jgi:exopolysaccharide biosynthesis WecB/TagA/CpsF family protein
MLPTTRVLRDCRKLPPGVKMAIDGSRSTFSAGLGSGCRIVLGGAEVDLMDFDTAVDRIMDRAVSAAAPPLGVVSANLDHIKHFGAGGDWANTFAPGAGHSVPPDGDRESVVEWLSLLDGAPLVSRAKRLTGLNWPRLAGSDLIGPLLDTAVERGVRVGFVGGTRQTQELLKQKTAEDRPGLVVAGWWAPERWELADLRASQALAAGIAAARVDLLVVGLGKPRQEAWISAYGHQTGAAVMLAFGAVVDFLAGRVARAPEWIAAHGLEWAWRLALEPRRLSHRYLVDGPGAYFRLRFNSYLPAEAGSREASLPRPADH